MSFHPFRLSILFLAAGTLLLTGCRVSGPDQDADRTISPVAGTLASHTQTIEPDLGPGVTPGAYTGPGTQPGAYPVAPTSVPQIIPLGTPAYPGAAETSLPLPSIYPGADVTLIPLLPSSSVSATPSLGGQLSTTTSTVPEETVSTLATQSPTSLAPTVTPTPSPFPGIVATQSGTPAGPMVAPTEATQVAATVSPTASQTKFVPTTTTDSTQPATANPTQLVIASPTQSETPGPTEAIRPSTSAVVTTQPVTPDTTATFQIQQTTSPGQMQLGGSGATLTVPAVSVLPTDAVSTLSASTASPPVSVQTSVPTTDTPAVQATASAMQTATPQPTPTIAPPEGEATTLIAPGQLSMQSSGRPFTLPTGLPPTVAPSESVQPTQQSSPAPEGLFTPAPGPVQPVAQLGFLTGRYNMGSSGLPAAQTIPEVTPSPASGVTPSPETTLDPDMLESPTEELLPTLELPTDTPVPPTATPYLTPTPTITPTPTVTLTPLPAPPWIYTRLPAADPRTVVLAAGKPQLVMFFAYWSGPSQAMSPVVQGLESEYQGRMIFTYLDIDDPATSDLQRRLGFRMEPHFFLLDAQGKILYQWTGSVGLETLRRAMDEATGG